VVTAGDKQAGRIQPSISQDEGAITATLAAGTL